MANRVQLEAVLNFVGVNINASAFNAISRASAGMPGPIRQLSQNLDLSNRNADKTVKTVTKLRDGLSGAEKVSNLFLRRMTQFAILLPTFVTLNKIIQGSVKFLFDFDKEIQDIIKANPSALVGRFDDIAKAAFDIGKQFGISAVEVAQTIKTYVNAGLNLKDANDAASLSFLAVRASTLDANQAMEFLLATSKQFGLQGTSLAKALDALVNVEGISAAESKDVAEAFTTGGNSFAQFGKSIYDTIGLISALREQTRKSGSEIGTIFKTIQTRIFAAGDSREAVESLGVSVQNLDGTLKPTLEVVNELSHAFAGMTEAQQANAAKTIAGVRQYEGLLAIIKSVGRANVLSVKASQSSGAAKEKEAVDAQKLQRQLDNLVVAAQEVAFEIGKAGGADALKDLLKFATLATNAVGELVKMFEKLKVPVIPILAPSVIKGISAVFGGGAALAGRAILGGGGGGGGGGRVGGTEQTAQSLRQLTQVIATTAQEMKVLMQATMTQSQLYNANIALVNLQNEAIKANIKVQQESAVVAAADAAELRLLKSAYAQQGSTFGSVTQKVKNSFNSIGNESLRSAVKFTALTVGATAATAGLKAVGDKLAGSNNSVLAFAGSLSDTIAPAVQMGAQFALLGPEVGILVGAFSLLSSVAFKYADAAQDSIKANKELAEAENKRAALEHAPKALTSGVQGLDFLQSIGKTIKGKTGKEIDLNRTVNEGFNSLSPATQMFIKDVGSLKDVLLAGGEIGRQTVKALSEVNSEAFVNQDALEKLRSSYDDSGKSSLTWQQQLDLLFTALGKVSDGTAQASDAINHNLIHTFEQMKKLQEDIKLAEDINKLDRAFQAAQKSPKDFIEGLDKLSDEAKYAAKDLDDIQRAFDALTNQLLKSQHATAAGLDFDPAKKLIENLNKELSKPENGEGIAKFLGQLTTEENAFAQEYIKIEEKRREAVNKAAESQQAVQVEIYKHAEEELKAQQAAAIAAAEAMAKFKVELTKVGSLTSGNFDTHLSKIEESEFQKWKARYAPKDSGADYDFRGAFKAGLTPSENGHWPDTFKKPNHPTFSDESIYAQFGNPGHWMEDKFIPGKETNKPIAPNIDTNALLKQITALSRKDIEGSLSGKSNLPAEIQEVISNTFVDGVKKAEINIKKVSDETADALAPIDLAIGFLQQNIAKLGNVLPNTTNAQKKDTLERELAAKQLERQTAEQDGYIKSLDALRNLTTETKKAQENEAREEAERTKKIRTLTTAGSNFSKTIQNINRGFQEFVKQRVQELQQKEADAYQELKTAQQDVLTSTKDVSGAWKDLVTTMIQVNGVLVEAQVKSNLLYRDIGILNGSVVTFQDKLTTLNSAYADGMKDASMMLEQRIQLERQLADQTLTFLKEAADQIQGAGLNVFGQSAQENNDLQRGIAGLSYIAQQLGGSFQKFEAMSPEQINQLSQQLLNLPLQFRKEILDALSSLPSTATVGGFNVDQLKQALGQVGAGVAPEAGLPAIADLNKQQIDQLKIMSQLDMQEAKLQLTQVVVAQQALKKAEEQLDVSKVQEQHAKDNLDFVRSTVGQELTVLEKANDERRELLNRIAATSDANALRQIENEAELFANQNTLFKEVGDHIVQGITQAIESKNALTEAQTSLNTFNTMQDFNNQAKGYIPNYAAGNLSPREAGGILRAAMREKRMMPQGANLAIANTSEAIIPMARGYIPNFAEGNPGSSAIAASVNSIRSIDQTLVAAIASSVTQSLSQISAGGASNKEALEKVASLLTELNGSISDIKTSNNVIQNNTTSLATTKTPTGGTISPSQEVKISLQTNNSSTVQLTGLDSLRDQLKQAVKSASSDQVDKQLQPLLEQLDAVFQALRERNLLSSFGTSRG